MHVNVCRDCYRAIERAPLLHVKRILRACEKCRHLVAPLSKPRAQQVLAASILADGFDTRGSPLRRPSQGRGR